MFFDFSPRAGTGEIIGVVERDLVRWVVEGAFGTLKVVVTGETVVEVVVTGETVEVLGRVGDELGPGIASVVDGEDELELRVVVDGESGAATVVDLVHFLVPLRMVLARSSAVVLMVSPDMIDPDVDEVDALAEVDEEVLIGLKGKVWGSVKLIPVSPYVLFQAASNCSLVAAPSSSVVGGNSVVTGERPLLIVVKKSSELAFGGV